MLVCCLVQPYSGQVDSEKFHRSGACMLCSGNETTFTLRCYMIMIFRNYKFDRSNLRNIHYLSTLNMVMFTGNPFTKKCMFPWKISGILQIGFAFKYIFIKNNLGLFLSFNQ